MSHDPKLTFLIRGALTVRSTIIMRMNGFGDDKHTLTRIYLGTTRSPPWAGEKHKSPRWRMNLPLLGIVAAPARAPTPPSSWSEGYSGGNMFSGCHNSYVPASVHRSGSFFNSRSFSSRRWSSVLDNIVGVSGLP